MRSPGLFPIRPRCRGHRSTLTLRLLIAVAGTAVACKSDTGPRASIHPPAIAPEVNKSLPTSLQTAAALARYRYADGPSFAVTAATNVTASEQTEVVTYVSNLFLNSFNLGQGVSVAGYVNALDEAVDYRDSLFAQQINGTSQDSAASCTSVTPNSYTIDMSAINPILKLTLNQVQCLSSFGNSTQGVVAGKGSGLIYGQNGASYSMWLSLVSGTDSLLKSGGYLIAANLQNSGSTDPNAPEQIDGMVIDYSPASIGDRLTATRFKSTPSAKTFELFLASSSVNLGSEASGTSSQIILGAGFRMISNGTLIYADGLMWDPSNTAAGWQQFTVCMTASTLTVDATAADCNTLAASFTLASSATLTYAQVSGSGLTGASIPGPASKSNTPAPTAAVANIVNAAFPIQNAASVTTAVASGSGSSGGS